MSKDYRVTEDAKDQIVRERRQRKRSIAIALALGLVVAMFYSASMVKMAGLLAKAFP